MRQLLPRSEFAGKVQLFNFFPKKHTSGTLLEYFSVCLFGGASKGYATYHNTYSKAEYNKLRINAAALDRSNFYAAALDRSR
jgi:hypothetical protein